VPTCDIKLAEFSTHNHFVDHFQVVYGQDFQLPHWLQVICLEHHHTVDCERLLQTLRPPFTQCFVQGIEQVKSVVNNIVATGYHYIRGS
jgi:hypothetical protein